MSDPQDGGDTPARKRIAVACGRCRKRKIRCSGDPGNNQPCSNCKNAGAEPCQFLRVASQETPMRHDGHFDYDMGAARSLAHRSAVPPSSHYGPPDLGAGEALGYSRGASSSMYGPYSSSSSRYYSGPVSGWSASGYGDGASEDYGIPCGTYYAQEASHIMPYHWAGSSSSRSAGGKTSSSLYVDTADTTSYAYGSHSTSLVHRPAAGASDTHSGFSLTSFAAALPSGGSSGTERLLPTPIARSLPSSQSSSSYRDGLSGYGSSSKSSGASSSSVISPTSPMSEAYGTAGIDSASLAGYASASRSYSDSYANGSGSAAAEGSIFTAEERGLGSQGSALELTGYTYGDSPSTRRASAGVSTSAGGGGHLSNGATYEPTTSPTMHYGHHSSHSHHGYASETPAGAGSNGGGGGSVHGGGHRASVGSRR